MGLKEELRQFVSENIVIGEGIPKGMTGADSAYARLRKSAHEAGKLGKVSAGEPPEMADYYRNMGRDQRKQSREKLTGKKK